MAIVGITHKVTLEEKSKEFGALAEFRGALYLAWTGTDQRINLIPSYNGGQTWDEAQKFTSQEKSIDGPFLLADGTRLLIGWTGADERLNVANVDVN